MMMNTEGLPIQLSIVVIGTDIIRNSEDGRSQYLKHIYINFMYPLATHSSSRPPYRIDHRIH